MVCPTQSRSNQRSAQLDATSAACSQRGLQPARLAWIADSYYLVRRLLSASADRMAIN
jgi:hypothetical protein